MVLALALTMSPAAAAQAGAGHGSLEAPWDFARPAEAKTSSAGKGALLGLLAGWQRAVAPVDGIKCPSQPSCSRYAAEAVHKHGAWLGAFMAADRLIHELSEADYAPLVETPAGYKIYDPVSANDFWLNWR